MIGGSSGSSSGISGGRDMSSRMRKPWTRRPQWSLKNFSARGHSRKYLSVLILSVASTKSTVISPPDQSVRRALPHELVVCNVLCNVCLCICMLCKVCATRRGVVPRTASTRGG